MTTLKLKKTSPKPKQQNRASVRRKDPAKRDRSVAPPIKSHTDAEQAQTDVTASQENEENSIYKGEPILRSEYPGRQRQFAQGNEKKTPRKKPKPVKSTHQEAHYHNPPRRKGKARDGFIKDRLDTKQAKQPVQTTTENKLPRLSKRMAELGLCSRREADEWIANGWVKVDGEIIDTLGTRVSPDAEIVVSQYAQEHQSDQVTILLHKPVGYVSGQAEDGYQPAIVLVHPDNEWQDDSQSNAVKPRTFQRQFLQGLAPAGRLDIDSTGLLVLTQDGRVARHLIGQDTSVEKEYLVRVEGELSEADLKRLNHGLSLDGEKLKPAKVNWQNEDQLRFVLREGKKRQIRRMCEMVGLKVVGLKRIRVGSVNLGKLPQGKWRYLRKNERF